MMGLCLEIQCHLKVPLCNIIRHHVTSPHGVMMSLMTSLGKNTDKEGTKWKGRQCSGVFISFVHVLFLVLLVQYLSIQHMTDYVHHIMNSFWNWIRILFLVRIWFSWGSSSPIYSGTGLATPITCEVFIPLEQFERITQNQSLRFPIIFTDGNILFIWFL